MVGLAIKIRWVLNDNLVIYILYLIISDYLYLYFSDFIHIFHIIKYNIFYIYYKG